MVNKSNKCIQTYICPKCSTTYTSQGLCPKCENQIKTVFKCPSCDSICADNDKYCMKCGFKLFSDNNNMDNTINKAKNIVSATLKKTNKKKLIIIGIVALAFILTFVLIVISTSITPNKLEQLQGGWYRYKSNDVIEFISFTNGGEIHQNKDMDRYFTDTVGEYTVFEDVLTYQFYGYSTHSVSFKNLNDEDIERGLFTINDSEWYVSDDYLVFQGNVYISSNLFWN